MMNTPVSKLWAVGGAYARRLEKLGIFTVRDLLYYVPSRYEDFSTVSKISSVQEGEIVTIQAKVLEFKNQFTRSALVIQKAVVCDDSGQIDVVWFNQRFLANAIKPDMQISLSGKIQRSGRKLQLVSPKFEIVKNENLHTGRLVPVYPETEGVSSKWLRARIYSALKNARIVEYLDNEIRNKYGLMELSQAVVKVHFPDSLEQAEKARKRLAFDELLISQIESKIRREDWQKNLIGNKFEIDKFQNDLNKFFDNLSYDLTNSQKKVIEEIFFDFKKTTPMNRLLQGDVGSGKTVVAATAMLIAKLNGFKSVLMAPTEILANQHFETLKKMGLNVGLVTANNKTDLNSDVLVGTHALLNDKINISNLGLVVIDEQHRFGVDQRTKLSQKGVNPHVLTMTATPIPRTVALTLYGDLDVSVISEMPKDRLPVKTWVVPNHKREASYQWVKEQKTQVFIICPLIEESENLASVKAATTEFENIKKVFSDFRVGLVHGRVKNKEKIIKEFKDKKLDILVATPVVEVGIDIPNASIIIIEAAERFGLAQLHQLRGRVGRGTKQSYCLLFSELSSASPRLHFMEKLQNGLALAEADLKFRGPGQRFGTVQHGKWDLKIADFSDLKLVEQSNELSSFILKDLSKFPVLREIIGTSRI